MNIGKEKLRPIKKHLIGFEGEIVIVEEAIQLPVTIEKILDQVMYVVDFFVVNFLFSKNDFGKNFLKLDQSDNVYVHFGYKFLVENKVGIVRENNKLPKRVIP